MSVQEQVASQGVPATAVFGFSVLVVFLLMAALYESWTLPFAVLLTTPIAMFGALTRCTHQSAGGRTASLRRTGNARDALRERMDRVQYRRLRAPWRLRDRPGLQAAHGGRASDVPWPCDRGSRVARRRALVGGLS